jgi:hypothetical protein
MAAARVEPVMSVPTMLFTPAIYSGALSLPVVRIGASEQRFSIARRRARHEVEAVIHDPPPHVYRLRIEYRERGYEAWRDHGPHPYTATFEIVADSPDAAATQAIGEFRRIQLASSVNWSREIVTVDVARVSAAEGAAVRR